MTVFSIGERNVQKMHKIAVTTTFTKRYTGDKDHTKFLAWLDDRSYRVYGIHEAQQADE
jgi:hypothetical protein